MSISDPRLMGMFATRTSMMHRMNTVAENQKTTTIARVIVPKIPDIPKNFSIVIDHRTSDS